MIKGNHNKNSPRTNEIARLR